MYNHINIYRSNIAPGALPISRRHGKFHSTINILFFNSKMRFITVAIFSFIVVACDPGVTLTFNIDNESDFNLHVRFMVDSSWARIGEVGDSTLPLVEDGTFQLYLYQDLGTPHDLEDSISEILIFIELYYNDSLVYKQNPTVRELWEYEEEKDWMGSGTSTYTLKIKNDDLSIGGAGDNLRRRI